MPKQAGTQTHHAGVNRAGVHGTVLIALLALMPNFCANLNLKKKKRKSANICSTIQVNVQSAALWHSATRSLISIFWSQCCGIMRWGLRRCLNLTGTGRAVGKQCRAFYVVVFKPKQQENLILKNDTKKYYDSHTCCALKVKAENIFWSLISHLYQSGKYLFDWKTF